MMTYLKRALLMLVCLGASYSVMANAAEPVNGDTAVVVCNPTTDFAVSSSTTYVLTATTCAGILKELNQKGFFLENTVANNSSVIYTLIYEVQ